MRNYFVFGNLDSRTYGVYISGEGVYDAPGRAYNTVTVPGRNGDLLIDKGRYDNIKITYPAFVAGPAFDSNLTAFRSALLAIGGYAELTDSYHPGEFRFGYCQNGIKVKARSQNDAGEFDITFNCKPQRFLTSGKTAVTVSSGGSITNPTLFDAKPIIRVTGYGSLYVDSDLITITSGYAYVDIDSETQDCYHGTDNANNRVTFQSNDFPVLGPGETGITYSGNITSVKITPRWWII